MRIHSCYKKANPGEHWTFWDSGVGVSLPQHISAQLDGILTYQVVPDMPMRTYDLECRDADITYLQKYELPSARPEGFVYTFVGDVWKHESNIQQWLDYVRPNWVGAFEELPQWLVRFCDAINCRIEFFPWFIDDAQPVNIEKDVIGLCSGCVGRLYPSRTAIYQYLNHKKFNNVVLSCASYGNYPLSNEEYRDVLSRSRYYLTGPIRDLLVAPKYREAMNYGAAVISPWVSPMADYGFEDGKNIIVIKNVTEIDDILKSDMWKSIGKAGQKLVQTEHTVQKRAARIVEVYREWLHDRNKR